MGREWGLSKLGDVEIERGSAYIGGAMLSVPLRKGESSTGESLHGASAVK